MFAPITYYRMTVPVVPLPQGMNDQTLQIASRFLREAAQRHQRFLIVADPAFSSKTLDWLSIHAAPTHSVRLLGVYEETEVLEFVPRSGVAP
jgi:hypothetical protein